MKNHEKPLSLEGAITQIRRMVSHLHAMESLESVFKTARGGIPIDLWCLMGAKKRITVLQACRIVRLENRSLYKAVVTGRF
jgi:hypothetical protein